MAEMTLLAAVTPVQDLGMVTIRADLGRAGADQPIEPDDLALAHLQVDVLERVGQGQVRQIQHDGARLAGRDPAGRRARARGCGQWPPWAC